MRSVWSRERTFSMTVVFPLAKRPASRTALFTCALATGRRYSMPCKSERPSITSGGQDFSLSAWRSAPIWRRGSITRCIGRLESEASPMRRERKGCAARMPAMRRIVVPEFPQSRSASGLTNRPEMPSTTSVPGSGVSMSTPSWRMAAAVLRQSSPSRKLRITQVPLDREASRTARWEMLLSGGTPISVSMRAARLDLRMCCSVEPIIR